MSDYIPDHRAEGPADEGEPVVGSPPPRSHTLFSNRTYDYLKFIALVLLPALATAYFALGGLWDLPKVDEVVGTIVVIDTFLGALLGFSTNQYNKSDDRFDGEIYVTPNDQGNADLDFALDSRAIMGKDEIAVKIKKR